MTAFFADCFFAIRAVFCHPGDWSHPGDWGHPGIFSIRAVFGHPGGGYAEG
jgi:hypothetical protein